MKKKLIGVILAITLAGGLIGCDYTIKVPGAEKVIEEKTIEFAKDIQNKSEFDIEVVDGEVIIKDYMEADTILSAVDHEHIYDIWKQVIKDAQDVRIVFVEEAEAAGLKDLKITFKIVNENTKVEALVISNEGIQKDFVKETRRNLGR